MKWFITGGCGFIGSSLIHRLLQSGASTIRVMDNLTTGSKSNLSELGLFKEADVRRPSTGLDFLEGDIRHADHVKAGSAGFDVIVHLAANTGVPQSIEQPTLDCEINVLGTLNALEAARANNIKRFVFASSGAPVGEVTPPIHEEIVPHPVSPYGASKLAGEAYCSAYYRSFGIDTVALRFGNVYGPGSAHKTSVVAKFITRGLAGEELEIYGDGSQTRDFIFIHDLVDAIISGARANAIGGEIFQIATGTEITVHDIAQRLATLIYSRTGKSVKVKSSAPRLGDVQRNFSDVRKAKEMLGWTCRTDLNEGLKQTLDYFLKKG